LPLIAVLTKESEMLQLDVFCEHTVQQKCDCIWGSALDPAGEAYSTPPDPLAGFKGAAWQRRGGGRREGI